MSFRKPNLSRMRALAFATLAVLFIGCGDSQQVSSTVEHQKTVASGRVLPEPYQMTCRDLREAPARKQALDFVADVLTAPRGQARRKTINIVRRSLLETCSMRALPNVEDPADYRPMQPIRRAVQNHFDQDAIYAR